MKKKLEFRRFLVKELFNYLDKHPIQGRIFISFLAIGLLLIGICILFKTVII